MDGTEQILSKSKISQYAYLLFSDIEIKKKLQNPWKASCLAHLDQLQDCAWPWCICRSCIVWDTIRLKTQTSNPSGVFQGSQKSLDSQPKLPHWPKQLVVEVLVPNYPSGVFFLSCDSVEQNFDDKFHLAFFFSPWILRSWSLMIWNTCIKNPSLNRRRSACIQLCIDEIQEFLGAAENQQILDFHCSSSQKFHTQISSFEI